MGLLRGVITGLLRLGGVTVTLGLLRGVTFGLPGDEISEGPEEERTLWRTGNKPGGLEGDEMGEADERCHR
jgi:hypothetical protein